MEKRTPNAIQKANGRGVLFTGLSVEWREFYDYVRSLSPPSRAHKPECN